LVKDLTTGPREVTQPVQEPLIECLHKIARTDDQVVNYATSKKKGIERSANEITMKMVIIDNDLTLYIDIFT
jgi:hypothetical protein